MGITGITEVIFFKAQNRGGIDWRLLFTRLLQNIAEHTHAIDTAGIDMARPLDYRLKQVAALRQVSIKTAREWKQGANKKWFEALAAVEKENKKRERTNRVQLGKED